jgi:transporter family-2 protein
VGRGLAIVLTLAAGALVAAFTSLLLSTLIVGALLVLAGETGQLGGLSGLRPQHLLGGIAGAAIVLVSLITVRPLGVGGVAAALVATQLIFSALIDRAGALGVRETPLTVPRVLGIALLIAGTVLVTSR